jgi:hypothetical protein
MGDRRYHPGQSSIQANRCSWSVKAMDPFILVLVKTINKKGKEFKDVSKQYQVVVSFIKRIVLISKPIRRARYEPK